MSPTSLSSIINPLDNPLHPNLKFLDDLEIPEIENRSESTEESANTKFHHWTREETQDFVNIFLRKKNFPDSIEAFKCKHPIEITSRAYRRLVGRVIKNPKKNHIADNKVQQLKEAFEKTTRHHWTPKKVQDFLTIFLKKKNFPDAIEEVKCKRHLEITEGAYRHLVGRAIENPERYHIEDNKVQQLRKMFQKFKRHHWTPEETQNFVTIFLKKKNISNAIKEFNCKHFFKVNHRAYYFLIKRVIKAPKNYGLEDNIVPQLKEAMQKISSKKS